MSEIDELIKNLQTSAFGIHWLTTEADLERDRAALTAAFDALRQQVEKLRQISALVSERHGDDDFYEGEIDEDTWSRSEVTIKRIFEILDSPDSETGEVG